MVKVWKVGGPGECQVTYLTLIVKGSLVSRSESLTAKVTSSHRTCVPFTAVSISVYGVGGGALHVNG